jgi:hypothetical protein
MRPDRYKIINEACADVTVEDLRVHLPGRGSWSIVLAASLEASKDFGKVRHLVRLEPVRDERKMPVWPFIKAPEPEPARIPAPGKPVELDELVRSVRGIEQALKELLLRPSPAPADVVAAHVHAIGQRGGIPAGLPGADPSDDPMFIPSKIVPDSAEADIQVREGEVRKDDFDAAAAALRRARKR